MSVGVPQIAIKIFQEDRKIISIHGTLGDANSEITAVTTTKDIATPAGTFSITFVPKQKWFVQLHPFDYIEIQMAGAGEKLVTVMRGLIDSVNKTESWTGGEPRRQITVTGRDLGCLLTEFKVYYIAALQPVKALLMKIMPWTESQPLSLTISGVFSYIWEKMGDYIDLKYGGKDWRTFLDYGAASMFEDDETTVYYLIGYEGDFWNAFCRFLDKPFHEFFLYDAPEKAYLIMRPTNLKDAHGNLPTAVLDVKKNGASTIIYERFKTTYQDPKNAEGETYAAKTKPVSGDIMYPADFYVSKENKISVSVMKNTSEIYTSYFTKPQSAAIMKMGFMSHCVHPYRNDPENCENPFFQLDTNYPACISKYGYRPIEATTVFMDFGLGKLSGLTQNMTQEEIIQKGVVGKCITRNKILVAWNMHNEFLLTGNMDIRGTNRAIIGTYVTDDEAEYYVEGVTHNFVLFQEFTTSLRLTRGMYLTPEEADSESKDKWNKYFFATNVYSKPAVRGVTDQYSKRG